MAMPLTIGSALDIDPRADTLAHLPMVVAMLAMVQTATNACSCEKTMGGQASLKSDDRSTHREKSKRKSAVREA